MPAWPCRGNSPARLFAFLDLGGFYYEASARRFETWRARLQAEIGADTLSKTQLNELWQKTKARTNKALNQAARDGLPPPLSPTFPRSASPTAPEFSSGAVVVSARPAAPRLPGTADGEALLVQAASLPGALQTTAPGAGGRRKVRWYEVGARPEARAQREAMYAHLVEQRPELASGTWSIPRYGKGTLRELLVERGVVPAELADRYAVAGAKARPSGGRARQEAAHTAGYVPALLELGGSSSKSVRSTDETILEGWRNKLLGLPPPVRFKIEAVPIMDHATAEKWALDNIEGLRIVDYGALDERVVQTFNRVVSSIAKQFGVRVEKIVPFGTHDLPHRPISVVMSVQGLEIGFNQWNLIHEAFEEFEEFLGERTHTSAADKSIEAIIAHEMGHVLQKSGRTRLGGRFDWARSEERVQKIVNEYRRPESKQLIIDELGERGWYGGKGTLETAWPETWGLAFGAYWVDRNSLRPETRQMVERVLDVMYPKLEVATK